MSEIHTPTGRRIYYDVVGEGVPLLAMTGLAGSRKALMMNVPQSLTARLRIIVMDNRDAGESDHEPDYYTMADMAGDAWPSWTRSRSTGRTSRDSPWVPPWRSNWPSTIPSGSTTSSW